MMPGDIRTASSEGDPSGPDHPTISIVMPAYNAAQFIREAIESVLVQTLEDLELIVIDDGSSDATWQIVDYYARRDPRVVAVRNETNLGIAATLNRGLELSRAAYVGRMDADDVSDRSRFRLQVDFARAHPEVAVVGSFAHQVNSQGEVLGLSETGPASIEEFARRSAAGEVAMVYGGTAVYRRDLASKVGGYDERYSTAEDLDFCDRMAEYGAVVALPVPLLRYRVHPTSWVMRTFFDGRRVHRYVVDRRTRQIAGIPELTLEEYLREERRRPLLGRLAQRLDDSSRFLYRMAGIAYGERHRMRAGVLLAGAIVANPSYALPRIWAQRISPRARRARRVAAQA